jgi:flagellar assembly factor FliW
MSTAATETANTKTIRLPLGLLGFERIKSYLLINNPDEAPFAWMQVPEDPSLAFLVVPPAAVHPDYRPELSNDDVAFIGLKNADDALIFNIVTLRPDGNSTVNLKGPVVLNRTTMTGKQVVLANSGYPLQHPLPIAA